MSSVCVVVPTFRRPDTLATLLAKIPHLHIPLHLKLEVLVLDNDHLHSAEALVSEAAPTFPLPLSYRCVSEPGLSTVRNYALSFVAGRFDFMAMIDDDEVPEEQWLSELVRIARAKVADVVVGPVRPIRSDRMPSWVYKLRERETPTHADGALLSDGWSSNALVRLATVARLGLRFDAVLNFAGGEDQLFFRQLLAGGGSIVFAAHAAVREHLSESRLTLSANLARAFRRGNSVSYCDRQMYGTSWLLALRALKSWARIGRGTLSILPFAIVNGVDGVVLSMCDVAMGAGMFAGLCGAQYQAYRHGR